MASIWDQLEALRLSNEVSGPTMRATPENPLQRWMRQKSVALADAIGGNNTLASRQIEEGLTGLGAALAGGLEPGGPERAGLVLSARNVPKLRAMMETALQGQSRTPENIALAWAKAKYPKLTSIPDYARVPRTSEVLGDYLPETNTVRVSIKDPTIFGRRKTDEYVDTVMHETQHARQAYRRRPKEILEKTGELRISPDDKETALAWDHAYSAYEKEADQSVRKMLERGDSPERAHAMRYELYRQNPFERSAWKAGETARRTYQDFQRFDTASRPGQRSRWTDVARDWIAGLFGGR